MPSVLPKMGILLASTLLITGCGVTINSDLDTEKSNSEIIKNEESLSEDNKEETGENTHTSIVLDSDEHTASPDVTQESEAGDDTDGDDIAPSTPTQDYQTVQFVVKDEQGNELYDVFTIAFEEKDTGKQIRKFPTGSKLVFSNVPSGEYNLLIDPVLRNGETDSKYKPQIINVTIPGGTNKEIRTIEIRAEEKNELASVKFQIQESTEAIEASYTYMVDVGSNETDDYYSRKTYTRGDTNLQPVNYIPAGSYHVRAYRQNKDISNIWETFKTLEIQLEKGEVETVIIQSN